MTVRIEGDRGVVSRDDGASTPLDREDVEALARLLTRDWHWTSGALTAAARSVLVEASSIAPRTDLWRPDLHGNEVGKGVGAVLPRSQLGSLLRDRYSQRNLGSCRLDELLAVLVVANGVLKTAEAPDGYTITHRGAPSAGARHPLALAVAGLSVKGLDSGLYEFDPFGCQLARRAVAREAMASAVGKVMEAGQLAQAPAAVIFLVCDFKRTLSRYPSGAALAWLDAGALALLVHLAALDTGLGSCIIGTSGALQAAGLDGESQDLVAVAVGSNLDSRPWPRATDSS